MNTITRFFELHNQGYTSIWTYIPFMILTLIVGIAFGISVLIIITCILNGNGNSIGIKRISVALALSSSIMLIVIYFMNITTINKEIEIIENRQYIAAEVNDRVTKGYKVSIDIGDGLTEIIDYKCTYEDTKGYNFIIDDTNKIIEIHEQKSPFSELCVQ